MTATVPRQLTTAATAEAAAVAFFDAYRARDVETMVALCTDTATFRHVPFEMWGRQRVLRGDGYVASIGKVLWAGLMTAFPDLTNRVAWLAAGTEGDVVAEVTLSGTQAGPWGASGARGGSFSVRHLFLLRVRPDGLIDAVTTYWDNADLHRQLGHLEVD